LLALDERLGVEEVEVMSLNRSLWTFGAILPINITLSTDTMLLKTVRGELLLLAILFSSLGLVGQSVGSSSPSSDNLLTGQTQSATPSTPATCGGRNQCGFSTPETQGKASPSKVPGGKLIHRASGTEECDRNHHNDLAIQLIVYGGETNG
jgi:hypothetical protein